MKNSPPAFPVPSVCNANGDVQYGTDGMSLRDYFAASAMQGMLSANSAATHGMNAENVDKIIAREAYLLADAMLAEREKVNP
jgi:hypothetical protein